MLGYLPYEDIFGGLGTFALFRELLLLAVSFFWSRLFFLREHKGIADIMLVVISLGSLE